jgi:hypothetical protein
MNNSYSLLSTVPELKGGHFEDLYLWKQNLWGQKFQNKAEIKRFTSTHKWLGNPRLQSQIN